MSSIIRLSSPSHQISIKPLNSNPATVSCPMFCSSLRKRPLWNTLRPLIAASSPWKLQESTLETHDFAIQMLSGNHESYLTVLVVCPADMIDAGLSDTTARLQRFAATTKGPASVIVFILDDKQGALASIDRLQDFMRLQTVLFEIGILCPALPVPDSSLLFTTLHDYLGRIQPRSKLVPTPPMLTNLIAHATASAPAKPLAEHDRNVVFDIFPSLQGLEEATRTDEGRAQLWDFVGRMPAEDIVKFWADEWIA